MSPPRKTEQTPPESGVKCPKCGKIYTEEEYARAHAVCRVCGHHGRIGAQERIALLADAETFVEYDEGLFTENPWKFEGYEGKINELHTRTGLREAVVCGECEIGGARCMLGVMDARFLMASMGSVVGEKLTRLFERATERRLPVVLCCASGGARMHEGIYSLMQMAKVSGAVRRHSDAGQLYITVLTDPTTGGVTASFAMLGDVILSEPGALIGFAGRRVIEGTIGEKLPEDFQSAEFNLENGFVDAIVPRAKLRDTLTLLLNLHKEVERVE